MRAKRLYLRPSYLIGLFWITYLVEVFTVSVVSDCESNFRAQLYGLNRFSMHIIRQTVADVNDSVSKNEILQVIS